MTFSYCTLEDLKKIHIGQELMINARYDNLTKEDGQKFGFVAKKDDVVVVQRILGDSLVVLFFEDTVNLQTKNREYYGEFLVELSQVQKFD